MKPRRPKTAPALPPLRPIALHARFTPEGPDAADRAGFLQYVLAAAARARLRTGQELSQERARLAKLRAASQAAARAPERAGE